MGLLFIFRFYTACACACAYIRILEYTYSIISGSLPNIFLPLISMSLKARMKLV